MKIVCTYCGSGVDATWEGCLPWDGKVAIECDNTSCGATWGATGSITRSPEQYRAEVDKLAESYRTKD